MRVVHEVADHCTVIGKFRMAHPAEQPLQWVGILMVGICVLFLLVLAFRRTAFANVIFRVKSWSVIESGHYSL